MFSLIPALIISFAAPGSAQVSEKASDAVLRADALHDQAIELQSDPAMLSEAARLHISEAALRSSFDASAVDCLSLAANLYVAARRPFDARHAFEQAADRALSLGDVQRAALLYLNGAFAAERESKAEEVSRLGRKADLLASSPLLTPAQRNDIHRRIVRQAQGQRSQRDLVALRADSLHARALELQEDPARMSEAAQLYKEEAKLRAPNDPGAVDNLMLAAHLLFIARRPLEARRTLEDAAERALGAGDIQHAALAYIEAAFVADREGNKDETQRLGHRAELLADSDHLTADQRQEITRRLRRVPLR